MPRPANPVRSSALALDAPVEWSLCFWKGFGIEGMGADEPDDLKAAWLTHGAKVLPHFIEQCPGMRPFALFALAEIPLPKLVVKPFPNDVPFKSVAGPIYESHCYGDYLGIYEHMKKLDLIPQGEAAAADKFFSDDPQRTPFNEYKLLSELAMA